MKKSVVIAATLAAAFSINASAALNCTNGNGDSIEWWPGMPRPVIDLTYDKAFICYVGTGEVALDYINARFPGLLVQGSSTLLFGDQARYLVSNVVRATRADYDALKEALDP